MYLESTCAYETNIPAHNFAECYVLQKELFQSNYQNHSKFNSFKLLKSNYPEGESF